MALDPRQVNRHRIVSLVGSIAIGLDNNYLPGRYDPGEDRAYLARVRGEAGDMAQWIAEAKDDEQRTQREGYCAQVLIDAEAVVRSYDAVREALPALAVLLNSDSPELRAETANLLAWFPEFAATSVPLLTAFAASEASPGAAATGVVALGLLGAPETVPFIRRYLDSTLLELRWAALPASEGDRHADHPNLHATDHRCQAAGSAPDRRVLARCRGDFGIIGSRVVSLLRVAERSQVLADPLCAWLPDVELSADRSYRGNPVRRKLLGEQLSCPLVHRVRIVSGL